MRKNNLYQETGNVTEGKICKILYFFILKLCYMHYFNSMVSDYLYPQQSHIDPNNSTIH